MKLCTQSRKLELRVSVPIAKQLRQGRVRVRYELCGGDGHFAGIVRLPESACGLLHGKLDGVNLRSLRKDQYAVRAYRYCGVVGQAVILTRFGDDVAARMTLEIVAVPVPIAV